MKSIDFKSVLIGILVTTTFFLATGYSSTNQGGEVGRYQFQMMTDNGSHGRLYYVLDTKTGNIIQGLCKGHFMVMTNSQKEFLATGEIK